MAGPLADATARHAREQLRAFLGAEAVLLWGHMWHLLHGNFGQPDDWSAALVAAGLAGDALAWPLWQTRREWPEASSLSGWARRFNAVVQRRDAGPRWLAGYSLGGRLALHALLAEPEMWQGAVIISAHSGLAGEDERHARREADALWQDRCLTLSWPDLLAAWNAQPVLAGGAADSSRLADLEPWREEIATGFLDWSTGCQSDLLPALATLTVPVLWLTGAEDGKFTALAARVAGQCPAVTHRILPGVGHRILADAPQAAGEAMAEAGNFRVE